MSYIRQFRPIAPIIWPRELAELAVWYARQERAEAAVETSKIWADHYAAVADYWDHKSRHPNTPAGAMTILHSWCKYLSVAAAVVTLNPIVIAFAVMDVAERRRDRVADWRRPKAGLTKS